MKKLLMGSIALFMFSLSIMIFEMSCKKEVIAAVTGTTQAGKLIFVMKDGSLGIENYDGTSAQKLSITLPAGMVLGNVAALSVSPDQKTIFFQAISTDFKTNAGYACNIDGSNVRKVDDGFSRIAF